MNKNLIAIFCFSALFSTNVFAHEANIKAFWKGQVVASYFTDKGKVLEISHDNGLLTKYTGLNRIHLKVGDEVNEEGIIATQLPDYPEVKIDIFKDKVLLLSSPIQ